LLAAAATAMVTGWNAYWAGEGIRWVVGALALGTVLGVMVTYARLEQGWLRRRVDFSDQLRLDFAVVGLVMALGVTLVTPLLPAVTAPGVRSWVWSRLSGPWVRVEQEAGRLFPDVNRRPLSPLGRTAGAVLPRQHKLGGTPEVLGRPVMTVRPDRGPLPVPAYWFGQAYDVYTGQGWSQSPWRLVPLAAGEVWSGPVGEARTQVWQTVQMSAAGRDVYGAGMPLAVDRPADALVYGETDLVGLRLRGATRAYTVLGAPSGATEAELRAAGTDYPAWVRDRYLQIPESVPARVRDLAKEITAGAVTPYARARAIEAYLREIPYSLQVPTPPPGRDVVDWFLFDLRRGYCDYYASAFVVLARSVGVPTRFAMGYATGTWDEDAGVYRVTEQEAHSWPEVFFPRYGWVPFEPTAARHVFLWSGVERRPMPTRSWGETSRAFQKWAASRWRQILVMRLVRTLAGILILVALAYVTWWAYWLWRVPQPARAYAQVLWVGARFGVRLRPGWTPYEFAQALEGRLQARRWVRRRRAWVKRAVARYVQWRYGRREDSP